MWAAMYEFYVTDLSDEIVFKLYEYQRFYDAFNANNAIGMCNVKIRGMCINKGTTQNYKIWYGRKEVGSLKLQTMWTPKQLQQVRFMSKKSKRSGGDDLVSWFGHVA